MTTRLVRPELALSKLLNAQLERNHDCLFAVAYIDVKGFDAIAHVLAQSLQRKRFTLRVVFRASDLRTDPKALDAFLVLAKGQPSRLKLRYSRHRKFHAKAYAFRRSKREPPDVVLGSANLMGSALAADSGELGVHLRGTSASTEAWDLLEDFWDDGKKVTSKWLEGYRSKYTEAQKKAAAANKVTARWAKQWSRKRRRRTFPRPDLAKEHFFVESTEPAGAELSKRAKRAANTAKKPDLEIPDDYLIYEEYPELPHNRNILQIDWFARTQNGVSEFRIVRLRKVIRVVDPVDNRPLWLVYFEPARRGCLKLKLRDRALNDKRLRTLGLSWDIVDSMRGYPRGRRRPLVRAMHALGWPKSKPG